MAYSKTKQRVKEAFANEIEIDENLLKHDEEADEEHKKGCGKCKKNKNKKKKRGKNGGKR